MFGTFELYKYQKNLSETVSSAIQLSNTHWNKDDFALKDQLSELLGLAQTSWDEILKELTKIADELPEKAYQVSLWKSEYSRLAVLIAEGISLLINQQYSQGRKVLESVVIPLQNINTGVQNIMSYYERDS